MIGDYLYTSLSNIFTFICLENLILVLQMSSDHIDHPLLVREHSDEEKSQEEETPKGTTSSSNDSGTNGPNESLNTSKQGSRALDESKRVKDGHQEMQHDKNGKTGTLQQHKTQSQNGHQPETLPVNNNQSETQSGGNRQTEDHRGKDGQSEMQREVESHEILQAKNNKTEQVHGSNAFPRQETSPSQTYSNITGGRSPPYNLRSTSNAPPKTLVRLLTVLFFLRTTSSVYRSNVHSSHDIIFSF